MKFLQSDLTLNLLLPPVVTYWHDHVQVSNLRTPSLLRFTATKVPTLVTLRSHSKVSNHLQLLIFVATTRFYQCLIVGVRLDTVEKWKVKLKTEKHCSKIIFKCVNSTVRPIFNEKVAEKWNLWVHEQCMVCTNWLKIVWQVKLCGYCSWTVHEQ